MSNPILDIYRQYEHLDTLLSDRGFMCPPAEPGDDDGTKLSRMYGHYLADFWAAIKAYLKQQEAAPESCEHAKHCWVDDDCHPPTAEQLAACEHRQPVAQESCVWKRIDGCWVPGCGAVENTAKPLPTWRGCPFCLHPIECQEASNA